MFVCMNIVSLCISHPIEPCDAFSSDFVLEKEVALISPDYKHFRIFDSVVKPIQKKLNEVVQGDQTFIFSLAKNSFLLVPRAMKPLLALFLITNSQSSLLLRIRIHQ